MLLMVYIRGLVKYTKNKRHISNLLHFFKFVKHIYSKQVVPLAGFKFRIAGRLGGRLRKSQFILKKGQVNLLVYKLNVIYNNDIVISQYGVFSLKLWVCELNEYTGIN